MESYISAISNYKINIYNIKDLELDWDFFPIGRTLM